MEEWRLNFYVMGHIVRAEAIREIDGVVYTGNAESNSRETAAVGAVANLDRILFMKGLLISE